MEIHFVIPPTVTCGELNAAIRNSDLPLFEYFFSFNEDGTARISMFSRYSTEFVRGKNFESLKKLASYSEGFQALETAVGQGA